MLIPKFEGVSTKFKVYIFSSDTSKWSKFVVLCPAPQWFKLVLFAFLFVPYSGLLFWWCRNAFHVGFNPYNSGCCRFFQKPLELDPSNGIGLPGVCHEALRISQISSFPYDNFSDPVLCVWEFKDKGEEGGKWCLEYHMYVNQMVLEKSPWLIKYVIKKIPYCGSPSLSSKWSGYHVFDDSF